MLYVGLGDALVRLEREYPQDPGPVLRLMRSPNPMLIEGAFRAVAMLRLTLTDRAVHDIISFASRLHASHSLRFWVAAAAAGWRGPEVEAFLESTRTSPQPDYQRAAEASLNHRYLTWRPL